MANLPRVPHSPETVVPEDVANRAQPYACRGETEDKTTREKRRFCAESNNTSIGKRSPKERTKHKLVTKYHYEAKEGNTRMCKHEGTRDEDVGWESHRDKEDTIIPEFEVPSFHY